MPAMVDGFSTEFCMLRFMVVTRFRDLWFCGVRLAAEARDVQNEVFRFSVIHTSEESPEP